MKEHDLAVELEEQHKRFIERAKKEWEETKPFIEKLLEEIKLRDKSKQQAIDEHIKQLQGK